MTIAPWLTQTATGAAAPPVVLCMPGDRPTPSDCDGDGKADLTLFRPAADDWLTVLSAQPKV